MADSNSIPGLAADAPEQDQALPLVDGERVPGPSPRATTNLMINDIILRSVGRIARLTVERSLLGRQVGKESAKQMMDERGLLSVIAAYGITKIATRSIPGAALVASGLVVKTLFDRSQRRREVIRNNLLAKPGDE